MFLLLLTIIILLPLLIYYIINTKKYSCDKGVCTKSTSGKYKTLKECETNCMPKATDEYSSSMYGNLIKYADITVGIVDGKIKGELNVSNNGLPFIFKNPDVVDILSKTTLTPKSNSDIFMEGQLLISLGDSTIYHKVNIELNKSYNTITITNSMEPGKYLINEDI